MRSHTLSNVPIESFSYYLFPKCCGTSILRNSTPEDHQREAEMSKRRDSRKYAKPPRGTTVVKSNKEEDIGIVGGHNDGDGALITGRSAS